MRKILAAIFDNFDFLCFLFSIWNFIEGNYPVATLYVCYAIYSHLLEKDARKRQG